MSDGGRERASLGVEVWKSSQSEGHSGPSFAPIAWLGLSEDYNACREEAKRSCDEVHTDPGPEHERVLASKVENTRFRRENDAVTNTKGDKDQDQRSGEDKRKGSELWRLTRDDCRGEDWHYLECESPNREDALHET
jgi:hypothetical protein